MVKETERMVQQDLFYDKKSKDQYKFHYISSYLYCFVVAGKIDDFKYDEIMEYVTGEIDIFTRDYGAN